MLAMSAEKLDALLKLITLAVVALTFAVWVFLTTRRPWRKVDARLYEDCLEHMAVLNSRIKELEAEVAGRADAEKHLLEEEIPAGWNLWEKHDGITIVWRRDK